MRARADGRLGGRVAIVTGATGGIGRATATALLREGATVVLVDLRREPEPFLDVGADAASHVFVEADITREADVVRVTETAIAEFGAIDILFNNAGITGPVRSITDLGVDDLDAVLAVNVRGVFLMMKHVLPVVYCQGSGSVVNTSSGVGLQGAGRLSAYVASKHAVVGLTKSAALEAAEFGVRVNSIHPSAVDTGMMRRARGRLRFGGGGAGSPRVRPCAAHAAIRRPCRDRRCRRLPRLGPEPLHDGSAGTGGRRAGSAVSRQDVPYLGAVGAGESR